MADPRACRDPFPFFFHLALAEVAEYKALEAKSYRVLLEPEDMERWQELGKRRVIVPTAPTMEDRA